MIPINIQVKGQGHVRLPHLAQLITHEGFSPETLNLVGRKWLISRWSLLISRARSKVKPTLDMLGKGALVFHKQLYFKLYDKGLIINMTINYKNTWWIYLSGLQTEVVEGHFNIYKCPAQVQQVVTSNRIIFCCINAKTAVWLQKKSLIHITCTQQLKTTDLFIMPPFKEGGAYCVVHVGRSVSMSVSLNLVQLITQEHFAPEASNLVHR